MIQNREVYIWAKVITYLVILVNLTSIAWFRSTNPVKTVLQEIHKYYKYFSCKICDILYLILHISCKSCTKNEAFLARYKKPCKNLTRQNYLAKYSCKILQVLQEKFLQDLDTSCKMVFTGK